MHTEFRGLLTGRRCRGVSYVTGVPSRSPTSPFRCSATVGCYQRSRSVDILPLVMTCASCSQGERSRTRARSRCTGSGRTAKSTRGRLCAERSGNPVGAAKASLVDVAQFFWSSLSERVRVQVAKQLSGIDLEEPREAKHGRDRSVPTLLYVAKVRFVEVAEFGNPSHCHFAALAQFAKSPTQFDEWVGAFLRHS